MGGKGMMVLTTGGGGVTGGGGLAQLASKRAVAIETWGNRRRITRIKISPSFRYI
jgi:hypothetical protein